ncbi:MAG: UDP-N-acetylmuramoyl-L-alanyl-D-glutamate--2,6-diaminopimelate ligase [Acidimicrobiia bacterium]|nr:UDP-N-acetylmuramoyl-L-alanyl-D-glutamate--2,6-diaminopimelate ligase [Acidimicrobiia bacterium]
MQLKELLDGVDLLALRGDPTVEIAALTHDSRRVGPGACFACVPGATTDGHAYADDAVAAGAVALLVERELDLGVAEAELRNVRLALGPVAAKLYGDPSRAMRCLGVTGTNAKTTTTYLLEAIARAAGERVGVVGTTGARVDGNPIPLEHTTPEAPELQELLARMRSASVTTVAMEVSSHALEQHRIDGTWFTAVGFTNLSHDHLDFHGTIESYFEAKASLFQRERTAGAAIGIDDPYGRELLSRVRGDGLPVVTFGLDATDADVVADDVVLDGDGARFTLRDRRSNASAPVELTLLGRFNVTNALSAAGIALIADFDLATVADGLSTTIVVPGRFERVDLGQPFTVIVDYAHTPDALTTALQAARALAGANRVIVVFGCGGDRDREKRPLMGRAAAGGADVVVLTTDNPRDEDPAAIAEQVREGLLDAQSRDARSRVVVEPDRRLAIRSAIVEARPGDVVVIAGKGHEIEQISRRVRVPFEDRAVARDELGARSWT